MRSSIPLVRAVVVSGLVTAAVSSGCAHALCDGEATGWHAVRTPHFVIHTPTYQVRYAYLADRLERYYAAFAASTLFGKVDAHDIDVVLFDEQSEFIDHFGYNRSAMTVHGAGAAGRRDGVLFFQIDTRQAEMAHALAHRLLRPAGRDVPVWYEEGMAIYAETVVVMDGYARFGVPSRKIAEARLGRLVTLDELFGATWNDFDGDRRGHYRNAAEELIRILVSGDGEGLPTAFPRFQAALLGGATSAQALATAWPEKTAGEVYEALGSYVRRPKVPQFLGFPAPGQIPMGLSVGDDDPASQKALCAACQRLSDDHRDSWPDWLPPPAAAPATP